MKASLPRSPQRSSPAHLIAGTLADLLASRAVLPAHMLERAATPPPPLAFLTPFPRLSVVLAGEHPMDAAQAGAAAVLVARPPEAVFIHPGAWNRPHWSAPVRVLELLFGPHQIGFSLVEHAAAADEPRGALKTHVHLARDTPVQHLLQALQQTRATTPAALRALLVTALLQAAAEPLLQPTGPGQSKAQRTHAQACLHIQAHLHQPLSRQSVARELNLSPTYLSRLFQRESGMPFIDYVRDQRLGHARHLLRHHRLPLKQVAAACGYADLAYFCRVFKQATGLTPTGYRNRPQEAGPNT